MASVRCSFVAGSLSLAKILVAAFRSPLMKARTGQEYRNVGSVNCNFFGYIH